MKVLLAGASGALGGRIVRELTAAGHEVAGLGRGARNVLRADLLDREAVLRAVDGRGFDAVVHAATALQGKSLMRHQDMAPTDLLRTEGTANLLAAARETGARRFVAESMVFGYGYGDHGDAELTEADARFGPRSADPWLERHVGALRTKEELTFGADGIEGVSLRFGLFYGAGSTDTTILPMLRRRVLPVVPDKGRALAWVDIEDAARAVRLALTTPGAAGQAYNIVDDTPIGFGSHVRAVAEAFATPAPMTVPLWLLKPAPLAYAIMSTNLRLAGGKARRELGWVPVHAGCATALRALADRPALAGADAPLAA
ncbi:NAD-dependent epimerase/dehydratase family protein [Streptomyces bambusae]|uniref:NAD-dependent epimerase/dehydratase family protein n=1 Tax=Streptomyces bambusae TaxID=1550616 RepID=A0ABS6Z0B6_9ACTN|nr:NAD(P)-dependent oxidoreductase [Streptomyces bambusae]MBW5481185.1 NAD-dependent epimerase/dehydratase family protein [Streptomyces bambusae]